MRLKRSRSRASSCAGWRYACLLGKLKIQRISESWHEASLMEHRPSPADPGRDHRWWLWDWQALRAPSLALRETTAKTEKPRHSQYYIVYTQYYTIFTYVLTYVIYLYCILIAWKNEIWGCFQRWQHRRKIDGDKNRSSSATTIECGAQCANYSATHRVNQRKTLKHRDVHKDAQSTAKHNAIWRSLCFRIFHLNVSYLFWQLAGLRLNGKTGEVLSWSGTWKLWGCRMEEMCYQWRQVLHGIAWYCDISRNNHKQVWYRLIMHFKNIQVYLSYCNIWYNIGPKSNPDSRLMQTPD